MGFFRALKSIVSPSALAEETVDVQYRQFRIVATDCPNDSLHMLLSKVLLFRWKARGREITESSAIAAMAETMDFSCLPPPSCVRALGLYVFYKENPAGIELCPQLAVEFEVLMRPVREAKANDTFGALYTQMNP